MFPLKFSATFMFLYQKENIARGTTDPEIESVHLSNLLNNSIYNHKWQDMKKLIFLSEIYFLKHVISEVFLTTFR